MSHQNRVYDSILGLLPNADNPTPIVRLNRVPGFKHAKVYGKLEWFNPFGAVKDRVAANLVRDAEEHHRLAPHVRLVEPTSGNTGIALAMIANAKGYGFLATVSNKVPAEKRNSLRLFGTDLLEMDDDLCPAPGAPEGAIAKAAELGSEPGSFHLNQYKNPANPDAHYRTTGPEIWRQTEGTVTHFVAGLGTCGTITGTGRFLKEQRKDIKVLGVHPAPGHDIPGVRSIKQLEQTALFMPKEYDGLVEVSNEEAFETCRRINQEESIIAGPSSGMALAGALKLVPDEPGVVCVVIFPDDVFKYSSSVKKHLPKLFPAQAPAATLAGPLAGIVDRARSSPDVIDAAEAKKLLDANPSITLADVRSLDEYIKQHPQGALNAPLPDIASGAPTVLPEDKTAPILTVCKIGERSLLGMLLLKASGYQNVKSVRGGLDAWLKAGLPTSSAE
ncbi:MAG TPA: pyridoxal-phosphate dependent enzyme [Polyangiaceae bacterium]|jgi:cysteine synthase/rhodanese-related sulfurtransferase